MHYTNVNPKAFAKRLAHVEDEEIEDTSMGLYEYHCQQELIAEDFTGFERIVIEWIMMDMERFLDQSQNERMERIEKVLMKLLKHFTDEDTLEEPVPDWMKRRY